MHVRQKNDRILSLNSLVNVFLCLQLLSATDVREDISKEESKSLWHEMAESLLLVNSRDRDRFLDLCLRRHVQCDDSHFLADFKWRSDTTRQEKNRFWRVYNCVYERNLRRCPVDGGWTAWSPWSQCSATCDAKGNQTRTRTCSNPVPLRGGDHCRGSIKRSRPCLGMCADPIHAGGKTEANAYLEQMHKAYPLLKDHCLDSHCTFGVVNNIINDKLTRAKYWSSLNCVKFGGACPVDGGWSQWSPWSKCSLKCGSGSRSRSRMCNSPPPTFGGHPCLGEFHHQQSCISRDCGPGNAETFTEWTTWTPCSLVCGGYGRQSSNRICLRNVGCDLNGILTPYINRTRPCYQGDCPSEGGWSDWTDWTECSAACGTGRQSRLRLCDSPFPAGGLYCVGEPTEFRLCKGDNCAGQSVPLGSSGFMRRPDVINEEVLIGKSDEYLSGPLNPKMEHIYIVWTPWTKCSSSCGQGTRRRSRWCSPSETPLLPCEGEVKQIQFCNVFVCPVAGGWGVWLPWIPCTKTCGSGKRQRYRQCNNPLPMFGGACVGDSMKTKTCTLEQCPNIPVGSWSPWSAWSACDASCGGGSRYHTRTRHRNPGQVAYVASRYGENDGLLEHATLNSDEGSKETLDCNTQPCPVSGSWAEWGEWSQCNALCGLGRMTRDRTCTDPSPVFGGLACEGPGSDLTHCFAGPCMDEEDRAIRLRSKSWIRIAPRDHPARFLVLYLHFKPTLPSGSVLKRYRRCRNTLEEDTDEKKRVEDVDENNNEKDRRADDNDSCQLVVEVKLDQGKITLDVLARGATLSIHSPRTVSLDSWHEVLLEVLKSGASLRINDQTRLYGNFSRQLVRDLDFDSFMTIGSNGDKSVGFEGSICRLSVNFHTQDLFASTDWDGHGTPVGRHGISLQMINPTVQLPHFRGVYYSPLRISKHKDLSVRMTMALDGGRGLLLYARGQAVGTLISLGLKNDRLVLCMTCSVESTSVCHRGVLLKLHQWYHVSLMVGANEAEMRVDQGKALQLTCSGLSFVPRNVLYFGGRSSAAWDEVHKYTNYTEGFYGVLGTIVANGRTVVMRQSVLLGRDGRVNPDGYSRANRITPVFAHRTSIVTLHCEISKSTDPAVEIKVIWLRSDTVLQPSDLIEITRPVGEEKPVGTLQLLPGENKEGIYACLVSMDGRLQLQHVFPVFRHVKIQDFKENTMEWLFLKILFFVLPVITLCCILFKFKNTFMTFLKTRTRRGKFSAENEHLLPTEPMELFMPKRKHHHGTDRKSSWDSYLNHAEGYTRTVDVVSFGPQSRKLSITPGIATERPSEVVSGQIRPGDLRKSTARVSYDKPQPPNVFDAMHESEYDSIAEECTCAESNYQESEECDVTMKDRMGYIEGPTYSNVSQNRSPVGGLRKIASSRCIPSKTTENTETTNNYRHGLQKHNVPKSMPDLETAQKSLQCENAALTFVSSQCPQTCHMRVNVRTQYQVNDLSSSNDNTAFCVDRKGCTRSEITSALATKKSLFQQDSSKTNPVAFQAISELDKKRQDIYGRRSERTIQESAEDVNIQTACNEHRVSEPFTHGPARSRDATYNNRAPLPPVSFPQHSCTSNVYRDDVTVPPSDNCLHYRRPMYTENSLRCPVHVKRTDPRARQKSISNTGTSMFAEHRENGINSATYEQNPPIGCQDERTSRKPCSDFRYKMRNDYTDRNRSALTSSSLKTLSEQHLSQDDSVTTHADIPAQLEASEDELPDCTESLNCVKNFVSSSLSSLSTIGLTEYHGDVSSYQSNQSSSTSTSTEDAEKSIPSPCSIDDLPINDIPEK